jgi:hypothetical protein
LAVVLRNIWYLFIGTRNFHCCEYYEPQKNHLFYHSHWVIRKYICRVYHQLSQYIAKLRGITIDLYKSCLITIETQRNHSTSKHQIVFAIVEKYIGTVTNFLISKKGPSFQITLKPHKNHNLNHFAPMHILWRSLCPRPPDSNTVGKLRLSSFCINKKIGGLLWADFELKLIQTKVCHCVLWS